MNSRSNYDIVLLSDLRLPGGTTASMAEEVRAQAAAGYRTALVHVSSPLVEGNVGVSRHIRRCVAEGLADLVTREPVWARLAVLRRPAVFAEPLRAPIDVKAERIAVVADEATDVHSRFLYDPARVSATIGDALGARPVWYPLGPRARRSLEPSWLHGISMADEDWRSPIDVDEWHVDRSGGVRGMPVIGRHGSAEPAKWPDSPGDVLAAYPDRADVRVHVLGGATPVADMLGRPPERWSVEPFNAREPADFLAGVDFFVYFPGAQRPAAGGRSIVEAMASGAVVVLPEAFRESFGDAAVYAGPADVVDLVRMLSADRDAYAAQSRRGTELAAAEYSRKAHLERLRTLIGAPSGETRAIPPRRRRRDGTRVLFVSSNGAGMGHLTRLLAMARRTSSEIEPVFLSLSQAVPVVERYGYPWEYCPSRGDLDIDAAPWNEFFGGRLVEALRTFEPRALVFDGTWPYRGLRAARAQVPDLAYVWSRRAMWRADTDTLKLDQTELFDLILEPGELAAEFDRGPTVGRGDAHIVGPVTLLDHTELLDRERARSELGMDPHVPALLIALGAGNINDITSDVDVIADEISRWDGWHVYVTSAPIATRGTMARADVRVLSTYPLARYLGAFDAAVAASGYNSYHELIMAGVPTLFVPNLETATDDQLARAMFAEKAGVGMYLQTVTPDAVADAFKVLTDPATGAEMGERARKLYPPNGAAAAIGLVEELIGSRLAPGEVVA